MHAFIITSSNSKNRKAYVESQLSPTTELIHVFADKSSIGIKQIQELGVLLSVESRLSRIIWIEEANLLTVPSQNVLLKMLEEPPAKTTFYLTCEEISSLLPTIRSRTNQIKLESEVSTIDPSILADLKVSMSLSAGDRLSSITKRDRAESLVWINQIEQAIKQKLTTPGQDVKAYQTLAKIAKIAQNAHYELSCNCSVSLVTQNFYLLLPHTTSSK